MPKKRSHQARHVRTSTKGKPFVAGKGIIKSKKELSAIIKRDKDLLQYVLEDAGYEVSQQEIRNFITTHYNIKNKEIEEEIIELSSALSKEGYNVSKKEARDLVISNKTIKKGDVSIRQSCDASGRYYDFYEGSVFQNRMDLD